ncbi:MAG: 2-amino-4-hydroxy-6-hydroxymethyldihydropteridine diphosphokinase [Paludibacteraceae bacterium]|nr:2-amino-4-hydroxy-6-hydroxymethyldihydropteridine diphosphokinase [Paludibacteraceae bacterium]
MSLTFLALGSNLGNREKNLQSAITQISVNVGNVLTVSGFIETKPVGFVSENNFLNAVMLVSTSLSPLALLHETQLIERDMGRSVKSNGSYSDRLIDIDILLYDTMLIDTPQLKIPHPLITERDFVLKPLLEIAPELRHPASGVLFSDYLRFI